MSNNIQFRISIRVCLVFIIMTGIPVILSAQKETEIIKVSSPVKASQSKIRFDQPGESKGVPVVFISPESQTDITPVESAEAEPKEKEQPALQPAKKEDQ
jgi:hypothetical protein